MSNGAPAWLIVIVAAAGCGGAHKPSATGSSEDECEPGRCLEDVSGVIDDHRPEARACYDAGHERDPTLQGRVVINFEIDATGAVVDAAQASQDEQITDVEVVDCIIGVIKEITFAKSARNKSTRGFHRFEFEPR